MRLGPAGGILWRILINWNCALSCLSTENHLNKANESSKHNCPNTTTTNCSHVSASRLSTKVGRIIKEQQLNPKKDKKGWKGSKFCYEMYELTGQKDHHRQAKVERKKRRITGQKTIINKQKLNASGSIFSGTSWQTRQLVGRILMELRFVLLFKKRRRRKNFSRKRRRKNKGQIGNKECINRAKR